MTESFSSSSDGTSTDSSVVVLHVPHSSVVIPSDLRSSVTLDDQALESELLKMTDWYTDELFEYPEASLVRFPVSRLIVDPERFLDDAAEPMAGRGMGVVYTATASGGVLRSEPDAGTRQELIDRFYQPHHQALESAVEEKLRTRGECVVVDCHSFPSSPLPYEICQDPDRPDLCIGTDPFHTHEELIEYIEAGARDQGLSVKINTPFSGSLVPMRYYRKRKTAFSVMLEINRSLYMDEATGQKSDSFEETQRKIESLLERVDDWHKDTFEERISKEGKLLARSTWDAGAETVLDYYGAYFVNGCDGFTRFPTREDAISYLIPDQPEANHELWICDDADSETEA